MKKFKLVSIIVITLLTSACFEGTMTAIGGGLGGVAGSLVDNKYVKPFTTVIGAALGAELGRRLGKYMDERDRQNLEQQVQVQLEEESPQTSVACSSNTRGFGVVPSSEVEEVDCGDKNKIVLKTSSTFKSEGKICKEYKTEVMTPEGHTETVPAKACKGSDGQWHSDIA